MSSNSNSLVKQIGYYFSFLMVALYVGIGLMFLFTDIGVQMFPVYREAVGGILLVYSAFRIFMIIRKNRNENDEA